MASIDELLNGHTMDNLRNTAADRLSKAAGESLDDIKTPAIEETIEAFGGVDVAPALAIVEHVINELMAGESLPMDFITD